MKKKSKLSSLSESHVVSLTSNLQWNLNFAENSNLHNVLVVNTKGQLLLASKNEILLPKYKSLLVTIIVEYFIENRINMGVQEFRIMTEKIIQTFPKEDRDDYLIESNDGCKPRGKLPEKFYNLVTVLKKIIF